MTMRETVQVYVTTEQRDALDAIAKARRWSRSTAIREALDIYLGMPDELRETVRLLALGDGVEPGAIVARLIRRALEPRPCRSALAKNLGDPRAAAAKRWAPTAESREKMRAAALDLWMNGLGYAEIARELGTTRQRVRKWVLAADAQVSVADTPKSPASPTPVHPPQTASTAAPGTMRAVGGGRR